MLPPRSSGRNPSRRHPCRREAPASACWRSSASCTPDGSRLNRRTELQVPPDFVRPGCRPDRGHPASRQLLRIRLTQPASRLRSTTRWRPPPPARRHRAGAAPRRSALRDGEGAAAGRHRRRAAPRAVRTDDCRAGMPAADAVGQVDQAGVGQGPQGGEVPGERAAEPAAERRPGRKREEQDRRRGVDLPDAQDHADHRGGSDPVRQSYGRRVRLRCGARRSRHEGHPRSAAGSEEAGLRSHRCPPPRCNRSHGATERDHAAAMDRDGRAAWKRHLDPDARAWQPCGLTWQGRAARDRREQHRRGSAWPSPTGTG